MYLRRVINILLGRDAPIVPAPCYNECNSALIEANNTGKVPALCASGSAFLGDVDDCSNCIGKESGQNLNVTTAVIPQLEPFVDYCNGFNASASLLLQSIISEEAVISSLEAMVTRTSMKIGVTSTALSATTTSNVVTPGAISSLPTTLQTSLPSSPKPPPNKIWIAAPVIGAIAFLLALWFGIDLMRRRRKAKAPAMYKGLYDGVPDKAQLHSDSIPIKERFELKGSDFHAPAELPAIEPAATELDADTVHIAGDS